MLNFLREEDDASSWDGRDIARAIVEVRTQCPAPPWLPAQVEQDGEITRNVDAAILPRRTQKATRHVGSRPHGSCWVV